MIRELEQTVRSLAEQMRILSHNSVAPSRTSPSGAGSQTQGTLSQLLRQQALPPPVSQPAYAGQHPYQGPQMPALMQQPWFSQNIAAPQASHPTAPPPLPPQQALRTSPQTQTEEWDDTYLGVLGSQDARKLRELLARSNPEIVMPLKGPGPLSQAVVLTLVHRVRNRADRASPTY